MRWLLLMGVAFASVNVGWEGYHLDRDRSSGVHQDGTVMGVQAMVDGNWYLYGALLGRYARGRLKGKSPDGNPLVSDYRNGEVQGRIGWQLRRRCWRVIPLAFIGVVDQDNWFHAPTDMDLRFLTRYGYVGAGVDAKVKLGSIWFGLLVLGGKTFEGRVKVLNDPLFDDAVMLVNEKSVYEVEVSIRWQCFEFVPFWRYRALGEKLYYPFDYAETKFRASGARFALVF